MSGPHVLQEPCPDSLQSPAAYDGVRCSKGLAPYLQQCLASNLQLPNSHAAMLSCTQFLLFTNDVEKIPSNTWCDVGNEAPSCAPGFFQTVAPDVTDGSAPSVTKAHPCCPGYFCPAMLTCMLPCPLGAYCPRYETLSCSLSQRLYLYKLVHHPMLSAGPLICHMHWMGEAVCCMQNSLVRSCDHLQLHSWLLLQGLAC